MLDLDKIIVLENGEEYLVLNMIEKDKNNYYYIAKINETETDIENNFKIVNVNLEDDDKIINEVVGEDNIKEILPLFINK